jgi:competence protein ComEA
MKRYLALIAAAVPLAALATVNVNTAQQSDLQRTKGLDKHKAKAIIEYRAQNGRLDDIEDLEKIPGFTPEVIQKIKPEIAFTGDAFVAPAKPDKAKAKEKTKT